MKRGLIIGAVIAVGFVAYTVMRRQPVAEKPAPPAIAKSPAKAKPPTPTPTSTVATKTPTPPPDPNRDRTLDPDPSEADKALAGLTTRDATRAEMDIQGVPAKAKGGVVVTYVDPRSPSAEAHLEKGDVIIRAHHDYVTSVSELGTAVGDREHTMLQVYRGGKGFNVVLHKPFKENK